MIKKDRVNRLAHRIIAPEREGHIGNPAGDTRERQMLSYPACCIDEIDSVVIVFLDPCRNGKHIGIKDDVLGREADVRQQPVCPLADVDLACERIGLPLLIESHDDGRRAIPPDQTRLMQEGLNAFLE